MDKEKKLILVVEDESDVQDALTEKLTTENFDVINALDGQEGLVLALQRHPDLILLDIILPKMDGFAVLEKLREDEWGKNVPVILLTNLSDTKSMSRALEFQSYEYLVKTDWKISDVVKKIKEQLDKK